MRFYAIAAEIITALVILLLAYTGAAKLANLPGFAHELKGQVLPQSWKPVLLYAVPLTELALAVALLFTRARVVALLVSLVLLLCFTVYTVLVLGNLLGRRPCSCGGLLSNLSWTQHLLFNSFFIVLILYAVKIYMHVNRENRKPVEKSR